MHHAAAIGPAQWCPACAHCGQARNRTFGIWNRWGGIGRQKAPLLHPTRCESGAGHLPSLVLPDNRDSSPSPTPGQAALVFMLCELIPCTAEPRRALRTHWQCPEAGSEEVLDPLCCAFELCGRFPRPVLKLDFHNLQCLYKAADEDSRYPLKSNGHSDQHLDGKQQRKHTCEHHVVDPRSPECGWFLLITPAR